MKKIIITFLVSLFLFKTIFSQQQIIRQKINFDEGLEISFWECCQSGKRF